jgi:hypothetical protein
VSLILAVCSLHSWPAFWAGYYLARLKSYNSGADASLFTDFAMTYACRQEVEVATDRGTRVRFTIVASKHRADWL